MHAFRLLPSVAHSFVGLTRTIRTGVFGEQKTKQKFLNTFTFTARYSRQRIPRTFRVHYDI